MGIKIVLTEAQYDMLESRVGKLPLNEGRAHLACRYVDFDQLDEELGNRDSKKIGYETVIRRIDDFKIGVKYHNTDILIIEPTNIIYLNNGGWDTKTTKDRLNTFLGCLNVYISQKNYNWYISGENGTFEYQNGIEIHPGGYIVLPRKLGNN